MAFCRALAVDEVLKIIQLERPRFERAMLVRAQVIKPHTIGVQLAVFGLDVNK
jgi:hypothetical protein